MIFIKSTFYHHLIITWRLCGGRDSDSDEGGGGVFDGLADGHGVVHGHGADLQGYGKGINKVE